MTPQANKEPTKEQLDSIRKFQVCFRLCLISLILIFPRQLQLQSQYD